jgi:hypothetical protein
MAVLEENPQKCLQEYPEEDLEKNPEEKHFPIKENKQNQIIYSMKSLNTFLKKIKTPICSDCIHYTEYIHSSPIIRHDTKLGICKHPNFMKQGFLQKKTYEYSYNCRKDKTKCGSDATFFEMKKI